MNDETTFKGIPPEGLDTPKGHLYYPPKQGTQVLYLVSAFLAAILLGWIISKIPGDLSEVATGVLCFIFLLVFFLGYGLWISFVSALLFSSIKWPLIKIIVKFFIRQEKPTSINELIPEREKLIELMLRAQKYSRTFFIISWPLGIAGGFATLFINTSMNSALLFMLVFICSIVFGYVLSHFGRRGYLPLPEE
jgi:MFS family permease